MKQFDRASADVWGASSCNEIHLKYRLSSGFLQRNNIDISFYCSRGFVLGIWSACASVGNIVGSALASSVIDYGYEVLHFICNHNL